MGTVPAEGLRFRLVSGTVPTIDEYLFVVHPIVAGHGPTLFVDWQASRLKLAEAKRFKSGVMALRYRRE